MVGDSLMVGGNLFHSEGATMLNALLPYERVRGGGEGSCKDLGMKTIEAGV